MKNFSLRMIQIGLAFSLMVGGVAVAGQEKIKVYGLNIPVIRLAEVRMSDGTKDQFAAQVGEAIRTYTRENKVEACAQICRAPTGEWGAIPITIKAYGACPIARLCPEGMEPVGEGIHSHNPKGPYVAKRSDIIVVGVDGVGHTFHAEDPDQFSDEDKSGGPGYMASPTKLWYFDGVNSVEVSPNS